MNGSTLELTTAREEVIVPDGVQDLREIDKRLRLVYPPGDVLVVAGMPGSGKSTLMRRCAHAPLIDSQDVRLRSQDRFPGWLPYAVYRPLVRLEHYRRLCAAMRRGTPLVVHDCGTVPLVRRWLRRVARRQGRGAHLLLLDASPLQCREGQAARGRRVSRYAMVRHGAVHRQAMADILTGPAPEPDWASVVVLDRAGALMVHGIDFTHEPVLEEPRLDAWRPAADVPFGSGDLMAAGAPR